MNPKYLILTLIGIVGAAHVLARKTDNKEILTLPVGETLVPISYGMETASKSLKTGWIYVFDKNGNIIRIDKSQRTDGKLDGLQGLQNFLN